MICATLVNIQIQTDRQHLARLYDNLIQLTELKTENHSDSIFCSYFSLVQFDHGDIIFHYSKLFSDRK